jgi:predicted Zn finger-like uncharacterized protein
MRIACPSCAAEYEVPASRLKPGKLVRCARCGGKWSPAPDDAEPASQAEAAGQHPPEAGSGAGPDAGLDIAASLPEVTAMDRLAASPAPPPARWPLVGAWVLTVLVLAAAVAATISWRDAIVRTWPPAGRILPTTGPATTPPPQAKDTPPQAKDTPPQATPKPPPATDKAPPDKTPPATDNKPD